LRNEEENEEVENDKKNDKNEMRGRDKRSLTVIRSRT